VQWRSIKVNVRFSIINSLRYLTSSSVCAVFGRLLPGICSVADPRSSARLQIAFTQKASNPFPEILQQLLGIQNQVAAMSRSELYLHNDILPITKVIGQENQILATATLFWPLGTYILASGQN